MGAAQQWYFYVPKGTTQLSFYHLGSPLRFFGPDGKLVGEVKSDLDFNLLEVPAGQDGQVWRIRGRIGHLLFFNAPNWVALSPDALLVPKDLAQTDSLEVRR